VTIRIRLAVLSKKILTGPELVQLLREEWFSPFYSDLIVVQKYMIK
jgi:hypothetical protein